MNRRNAIKAVGIGLAAPLVPSWIPQHRQREQYIYAAIQFTPEQRHNLSEFDSLERDLHVPENWPNLNGLRVLRIKHWIARDSIQPEIVFMVTLVPSTFNAPEARQLRQQVIDEWRKRFEVECSRA